MTHKIKQGVIGGLIATAVMTVVTMVAPFMGMPEMNAAAMLSSMLGISKAMGWIMHFMIGVIFALAYAFIILRMLAKIKNNILKGTIFGILAFLFAQIMMAIMGMMMPMPAMEGSMMLMMTAGLAGHIIFGITVALFVKQTT